jgi:AraC-like DNA-binding protein
MRHKNVGSNYTSEADLPYAIYFKKDDRLLAESEFHESIEFLAVISGSVQVFIGEQSELLTPGMIAYSPSFIRHHYIQKSEKILCYVLSLSFEYSKPLKAAYPGKEFPPYLKDVAKNQEAFVLLDHWIQIPNPDHLLNSGYAAIFYSLLAHAYPMVAAQAEEDDDLSLKILRYIDQHYLEDISLKSVAEEFGYSMEYCSKIIGRATQMNFRNYLNFLRFRKADELFNDKRNTLSKGEIIASCGFTSAATFYRNKKKYEAMKGRSR